MNIDKLKTEEIQTLIKELEQELENRMESEKKALADEIRTRAEALGIPVRDLMNLVNDKSRKKPGAVQAKYANPDNPSETWAGRGRKPRWVDDQLKNGKTLDDLLIDPK